jgi:peptidoglycan/xylan/chitin deacetylase (PgdA/CDA1 family)
MRRRALVAVSASSPFAGLVAAIDRLTRSRRGSLAVVTYHRVDHPASRPDLYPRLISASPAEFDEQIEFLARRYRLIGLDELVELRLDGRTRGDSHVLVTFDDAYRDFVLHAWPTLKRHGVPVALFVPTAYAEETPRSFWWDRLWGALHGTAHELLDTGTALVPLRTTEERTVAFARVVRGLRRLSNERLVARVEELADSLAVAPGPRATLDWPALRSLLAEGVCIGAHTRTHPRLEAVAQDALDEEIAGSRIDLQRELGTTVDAFAYPAGVYDAAAVDAVGRAGFRLAFTTSRGVNRTRTADPLRLKRVNIGGLTNLPVLRLELRGLACSV